MLVLSRTKGQSIVINGVTEVTVLDVLGSKVRLGIVAPEDVRIDRSEVHERRAAWAAAEQLETAEL